MRVLKQVVRYRLKADKVTLEAHPLVSTASPAAGAVAGQRLTLLPGSLVYLGIKHFPVGPKESRPDPDHDLPHADAYYGLLQSYTGPKDVPKAVAKANDCIKPSTPDCACCPPAIYS